MMLVHPDSRLVTTAAESKLGARIFQYKSDLLAACQFCDKVLGWTWGKEEATHLTAGFWSCIIEEGGLRGCGLEYKNPLHDRASSLLELDHTGVPASRRITVADWAASWLGRESSELAVSVG